MKKIFLTLALSALTLSGFAQAQQNYVRVEFNVPMTSYDDPKSDKSGTAVAQGMKDYYIYVNPAHQYLDFNVTEHPFGYRSTTNNFNEYSYYYFKQTRNTQTYIEDTKNNYPYDVQKVTSMTTYSIPVEKVNFISNPADTIPQKFHFIGDNKDYMVGEFTFDRLPRNVAELKTLIEPNGDGKRTHCHNPEFVVAVGYLLTPRLLDCAQDCRDMFDYLFGRFDGRSPAFSNSDFQHLCTATYNGGGDGENGGGKDGNCLYWDHNHVYQWFDGALPSNQYRPNGKDYGYDKGPYKVYVVREVVPAAKNRYFIYNHPYDKNFANRTLESPDACVVFVESTDKGFYLDKNALNYFARGKVQSNPNL